MTDVVLTLAGETCKLSLKTKRATSWFLRTQPLSYNAGKAPTADELRAILAQAVVDGLSTSIAVL